MCKPLRSFAGLACQPTCRGPKPCLRLFRSEKAGGIRRERTHRYCAQRLGAGDDFDVGRHARLHGKGPQIRRYKHHRSGALIGLLSLVPRNGTPKQALEELPNMFVSDLLYSVLPINFKVFHKFGPFSKPMHDLRNRIPKIGLDPKASSPVGRLLNDWVDLVFCAMTPSTFELKSKGVMSPNPEIDDLVDFAKLKNEKAKFYVNSFNLDNRVLEIFDNASTTVDAYHATEAMPVLFAPHRMPGGNLHTTGATHDPTGLQAIWLKHRQDLETVVMLDPMSRAIWRTPANIHDSFQLMLMNPIIALQLLVSAFYAWTDHASEQTSAD